MAYLGNNHRLTHFLLSAFLSSQPTTYFWRQGCTCQAFSAVYTASRVLFPPFLLPIFSADMADILRIVREHSALSFSTPRTIFCLIYQCRREYSVYSCCGEYFLYVSCWHRDQRYWEHDSQNTVSWHYFKPNDTKRTPRPRTRTSE